MDDLSWRILQLSLSGMSNAAIARVLGVSAGTVNGRVYRGKVRLGMLRSPYRNRSKDVGEAAKSHSAKTVTLPTIPALGDMLGE